MTEMPVFVKREVEKLEEVLAPLMKKVSKYAFWSLPLITLSIVNLFFLLFIVDEYQSTFTLIFYAIIGAFGLALSKEAKLQRKELHKKSADYIIKRIKKSNIVTEDIKNKYVKRVQAQPIRSINYFIQFLEEENRINRNQWQTNT